MKTILAVVTLIASIASASAATSCDQLAALKLPDTEINSATLIEKDSFKPPTTDLAGAASSNTCCCWSAHTSCRSYNRWPSEFGICNDANLLSRDRNPHTKHRFEYQDRSMTSHRRMERQARSSRQWANSSQLSNTSQRLTPSFMAIPLLPTIGAEQRTVKASSAIRKS